MLGGRALNRSDIFDFGLQLLEGCWHMYNSTPTGISPEGFPLPRSSEIDMLVWKWKSNDTIDEPHTQISRKEFASYGFWTINRNYYLRPGTFPLPPFPLHILTQVGVETMESLFYAYRLTGNKTYADRAWQAFTYISALTRAPHGYSSIRDVMTPGGWYQADSQESFWLAETLGYLYLVFDDPQRVSLDEWVFNTEGHPLRRGRRVEW